MYTNVFIAKFRYTPSKYYYQVYFTSIPNTLCCVYDGSRFRVLHQKQAFSLPSWQSGQRIGCILLGKWVLQMKIQIHKFGFSLQCQYLSIAYYIKSQRKRVFLLSFYFSRHMTFMQIQFMSTSPQTRITDQLALYLFMQSVLMQIIPTHNQNPQAVIESQC